MPSAWFCLWQARCPEVVVFSVPGKKFTSPSWRGTSNGLDGIGKVGTIGATRVCRFTSCQSSRASRVATSSSPAPAVVLSIAARVIAPSSWRLKPWNCPVSLESTRNQRSNRRSAAECDACMSAGLMLAVSRRFASSARSIHAGPKPSRRCECANRRTNARSRMSMPAYAPEGTVGSAASCA